MKTPVPLAREMHPAPDRETMTDGQLLPRFIEAKDQTAFAALVQLHGPMVYGVCRRVLRSHHDAEDAFQATFLVLARKAPAIAKRELLPNWLYRVACHIALKAKVAAAKRRSREQHMSNLPEPESRQQQLWLDLEPLLDQELSRLPDKYRIPVVVCDLEGRTRKEAAQLLGCPEDTLSTRLRRARSLLAERLTRRGVTLSAGALAVLLSQTAAEAAVPTSLVSSTVTAASVFSGGQAVPAGAISSQASALTHGMLKTMFLAKMKVAAAILVLVAAAGVGVESQRADLPETATAELPPEIRQALEQNAQHMNPIAITYTKQLRSRLTEQETLEKLELSPERSPPLLLETIPYRVILQGEKFYTSAKNTSQGSSGAEYYPAEVNSAEGSFDGTVSYNGHRNETSRNPGRLRKQLGSRLAAKGRPARIYSNDPYFKGLAGLSFPEFNDPNALDVESDLLRDLRKGGKLISVENVMLADRPHVKIEVTVANAIQANAAHYLKQFEEAKPGARFTPEEQAEFVANVLQQQKLPKTKRLVYYLDPDLNYALRRLEEWYDPDTLLLRSDCSEFTQLSDRQLWLPRHCETEIHEFQTLVPIAWIVPHSIHMSQVNIAHVFADSFLTEVVDVSELGDKRFPDEQFVLNYTTPGMTVIDDTVPETAENPQGEIVYEVGETAEETQLNRDKALQRVLISRSNSVQPRRPAAESPRSAFRWIMLGNGLAALLGIAYVLYRRYAR